MKFTVYDILEVTHMVLPPKMKGKHTKGKHTKVEMSIDSLAGKDEILDPVEKNAQFVAQKK